MSTKQGIFRVLQVRKGYWCYFDGQRSAGYLPETPLNEILKWILEQISFGHITYLRDEDGNVVSLNIGQEALLPGISEDDVGESAKTELLALNIAAIVANCREKGSSPKNIKLEEKIWGTATKSSHRRMEMHYALILTQLLGRISKKLPELQLLPILEKAPANTKELIAEATRCYLLKLDCACISLCRACLEDSLKNTLTKDMKKEWEIAKRSSGPMPALIEVCAKHGILKGYKTDAHDIREAGNQILHSTISSSDKNNLASEILTKTRKIIAMIHQ